jgi:hypothetical protein
MDKLWFTYDATTTFFACGCSTLFHPILEGNLQKLGNLRIELMERSYMTVLS